MWLGGGDRAASRACCARRDRTDDGPSASQRQWPLPPWTRCLQRQSRNCRPLMLRGFSRRTRPLLGEAGTATLEFALVAIPSAIAGSGRASWVATRSANRPSRVQSVQQSRHAPLRSTWPNTGISSASRKVDRPCNDECRPACHRSSAPARPAPRSPHPARQSLRPGSESADPSAVNCVVVPQSHMITSFPVRETHNPPTAPSGSRFPLGTARPARRHR